MEQFMQNAYLVNTLTYDPALCIGCGLCVAVCPHGVFEMDGRLAKLVNSHACMECGACQKNCPPGAIFVESGVGCASAMILAALKSQAEPSCGGECS
jgi:ferredoxin